MTTDAVTGGFCSRARFSVFRAVFFVFFIEVLAFADAVRASVEGLALGSRPASPSLARPRRARARAARARRAIESADPDERSEIRF